MAATVFAIVSIGATHAETFDVRDWYRRAQALAQSLIGDLPAPDHEVISPPADIDPKMALLPPQQGGTMRMIIPPGESGRRR